MDTIKKYFSIMKIAYLLSVILIIAVMGCNSTNEPNDKLEKMIIPLKNGNYWLYRSYELNQWGGIIESTIVQDSLILLDFIDNNNVYSFNLVRHRNGLLFDTLFFQQKENRLYLYQLKELFIPDFQGAYLPVINYNINTGISWNLLTRVINDFPDTIDGKHYKGNYRHTINGTYVSQDTIIVDDKKYLSNNFSNKYDSKLEFKIVRKNYKPNGSYYYDSLVYFKILKYFDWYRVAEGVGLAQIRRDSYNINIFTEPSSTISSITNFNGRESMLIKFGNINK